MNVNIEREELNENKYLTHDDFKDLAIDAIEKKKVKNLL
jgi:hypothetical protein